MAVKSNVKVPSIKKGKVTGYIANVARSVEYAGIAKLKRMNPTISAFSETNAEVFKTIYKSAIDYRTTYKRGVDAFKKSKFYEAGAVGIQALKEDIKTGNLYNLEREKQITDKLTDSFLGSDDDYGSDFDLSGFDDVNMDDWDNDDYGWDDEPTGDEDANKDTVDISDGDKLVASSIEGASEANANAVSMAIARSAEYQSEISIKNTNLLYTHNIRAFGMMNSHLEAMNSNIGSVMGYLDNNLTPHLQNSTEFFSTVTPLLQDQVALLREIAQNTKPKEEEKKEEKKKEKITYDSIVDANGLPDFDEYVKKIKKNVVAFANEQSMGMGSMLNMLGDDTNILTSFVANPYGYLLDKMMDKVTPKTVEKAFLDLNKSIGGLFGSFVTKFNTMANDSEGSFISKAIGKIFGVRAGRKSSIDTSNYNKGKVDWNGKSEKALTELIPNKLDKIISLLSGKEETTYDYETGRYVTMDQLQGEYDKFANSFWKNASSDIRESMNNMVYNNLAFNSKKERDQLLKDIEKLFQSLYDRNELLDINGKNLPSKYIDYGVSSENNMAIIQAIAKALPKNEWHKYNDRANSTYQRQKDEYERMEKSGRFNILNNNSKYNEFAKKKNGKDNKDMLKTKFNQSPLIDTTDRYGRNVFYYLQNMYRELNYIRKFGASGYGGPLTGSRDVILQGTDEEIKLIDNSWKAVSEKAIKMTDKAKNNKSPDTIKKEREDKENEKFLKDQTKRMDKNKKNYELLVNVSDLREVSEIRGALEGNISANKIKEEMLYRRDKKDNILERVLAAKTLSDKSQAIVEKMNEISKKPTEFLEKSLSKVDEHLFNLIYGKEGLGKEKDVKGFLDAMIFQLNKSFLKFNNFMEENILNPLKDKLGLDMDKSLFKGLMERFGIDEKKKNVKDWLKERTTALRDAVKESFKSVGDSVKDAFKDVFSPIADKFKSNKPKPFKKKEEGEQEDEYEVSDSELDQIKKNYQNDYFERASAKEKVSILDNKLTYVNKYKNVNAKENNPIQKSIDRYNKKLADYDKSFKKLDVVKKEEEFQKDIEAHKNKVSALEKEFKALENNPLADKRQVMVLRDRLDAQKAKLYTIEQEHYYFTLMHPDTNIDQLTKEYNEGREKIIKRRDAYAEKHGYMSEEEIQAIQGDKQKYALQYLQSSEYKNLSESEKKKVFDEVTGQSNQIKRKGLQERLDYLRDMQNNPNVKKDYTDEIKKTEEELGKINTDYLDIPAIARERLKILNPIQKNLEMYRAKAFSDSEISKKIEDKKKEIKKVEGELSRLIQKQGTGMYSDPKKVGNLITKKGNEIQKLKNELAKLESQKGYRGDSTNIDSRIASNKKEIEDLYNIIGVDFNKEYTTNFMNALKEDANFIKDKDGNSVLESNPILDLIQSQYGKLDKFDESQFSDLKLSTLFSKDAKNEILAPLLKNMKEARQKHGINNIKYKNAKKEHLEAIKSFSYLENILKQSFGVDSFEGTDLSFNDAVEAYIDKNKRDKEVPTKEEPKSDKDKKWIDHVKENGTRLLDKLDIENKNTTTISDIVKDILGELKTLTSKLGSKVSETISPYGPRLNPFTFPNIEADGEKQAARDWGNRLSRDISDVIFRNINQIPGHAKGGYIDKDHLAVVGKGEYIISDEKRQQITGILADKIRSMANSKKGILGRENIGKDAQELYTMIASIMGNENIDPNILMGMLQEAGDAGKAFNELQTREESMKIGEMIKRTQYALNQRNEGKLTNTGKLTEEAQTSGVQDVFSETFKIYKRTLDKTMNVLLGDDPEKERTKAFEGMGGILKEAKIYAPDLITGGLLGTGASILTGFMVGPLLGAGLGAGIALTKNSQTVQNMLFGEQEYDKDGNIIGRAGGLVPKTIVNKVGKIFPDLKKFGIVGAVSGLLPLVPFGPVGGLLLGSGVAFAKNNAIVQEKLFGESGILPKEKLDKFKDRLPNILAGAGIGLGLNILGFSTPFGLVGNLILGSGLGFASKTDKFQKMIFGEYDEDKKKYVGGVIPYLKDHLVDPVIDRVKSGLQTMFDWAKRDIFEPMKEAFKPITKQIKIMFGHVFGGIRNMISHFLDNTLVAPMREVVKKVLNYVTMPFRKLGSTIVRGIGKVISAPFRAVGSIGRVAKKHQIKIGKADYMTAQERLDYMEGENESKYFYEQGRKQMNDSKEMLLNEMQGRFGNKDRRYLQYLMAFGKTKDAEDFINKKFGDVQDQESIAVRDNMLANLSKYKKMKGYHISNLRVIGSTHGEKVRVGKEIKDQNIREWNLYNQSNPDTQISFEDFMTMKTNSTEYADKVNKSYNLKGVDQTIAGMTDEQLKNLKLQWSAVNTSDKDYKKQKRDTGKYISKLINDPDLNLPWKQRRNILGLLDTGHYDLAIKQLNDAAQQTGIKSEVYNKFDTARTALEEFKVTDQIRIDKDKAKNEYEKMLKQMFGKDVSLLGKDITNEDFFGRIIGEIQQRKARGLSISNEDVNENDPVQQDVQKIVIGVENINTELREANKNAKEVLDQMKIDHDILEAKEARRDEKIQLNDNVYRSEQKFTGIQKQRIDLVHRLGYKSLADAPIQYQTMPLQQLKDLVATYESTGIDTKKIELATKYGYKNIPKFMQNMDSDQLEKYLSMNKDKKIGEKAGKGEGDEEPKKVEKPKVKIVDDRNSDKETTVSTLDDEGNEVRMKKDNKTGQMEADLSDTSTKKSITAAKTLKAKQMAFYDKFLSLFKKEKDEEKEEKKGGWLTKLLAALGIGKSLLGGAKNFLGGVLGKGLLGGLFSRGILGTVGKGALIIGGLMYLPEIIDLFKTKIAPSLSEAWKTQIKPWLVDEGVPRLKEGVQILIKELPGLIASGIKFTVSELIPSLGKGLLQAVGWDIGDNKQQSVVQYTDSSGNSYSSDQTVYDENGNQVSSDSVTQGQTVYDQNGNPLQVQSTGIQTGSTGQTSVGKVVGNYGARKILRKGAKYATSVKKNVAQSLLKEGDAKTFFKSTTKEGASELLETGAKRTGKDIFKSALKGTGEFALHPLRSTFKGARKLTGLGTDKLGKYVGKKFLKMDAAIIRNAGGHENRTTARILENITNNSVINKFVQWFEKQLAKLFSNPTVIRLLGTNKAGKSIAKCLSEGFCVKLIKLITQNLSKATAKTLARITAVVGTGGLINIAFGVWDFVSGFIKAKEILGLTSDTNIGIGARIAAGLVKTLQGISIVLTLIPTSTIMKLLIECLSAIGVDMSDIQQQQEQAQAELNQYNQEHGTSLSLEEYNKEIKNNSSNFNLATQNNTTNTNQPVKINASSLGIQDYTRTSNNTTTTNNKSTTPKNTNVVTQSDRLNTISFGHGEGDRLNALNNAKEDIENSELGSNIQESATDYIKEKTKNKATTVVLNNSNRISSALATTTKVDTGLIGKMANKVKSALQFILNSKTVINILGQTKDGTPISRIIYDNFVPKFIQAFSENLAKSLPEVVSRMSSSVLSAGTSTFAFAVTDFISGFEHAASVLGVIDKPSFLEKVIAGMLEAIKGLSLLAVVPSDLVVSLLFDALEFAGIDTGNIGDRRVYAKQVVSEYNKKNNTSYTISDYNENVNGETGFFSNIASSITSGFERIAGFFGRGEGDIANGNPYFSQKEATGSLGKMISDSGCGPTSTAMALSKVTGMNISPETIAKDAYKNGSWDSDGARGNMFSTEASKYGVKTIDAGGSFEKFDKLVSAGIPTAVSGTYGKGDSPYTSAGHIVTVFGKDKDGNYLVNDPRGKQYSKAYTKEELMNGFRNSWSFGKGEDDAKTSDTTHNTRDIFSNARSLKAADIGGRLYSKSTSAMNMVNTSVKDTGLIESAAKVLQEIFTKIFTNETIVEMLGSTAGSNYSAASTILATFVPQLIKKLKQNCETNNNITRYLRLIIEKASVNNISFLITDFINGFNNPSTNLGKFDTYTIGMKVCSAIMSVINNRFVVDKILTANDWIKLLENYLMPVFGESDSDIKSIKAQAEKVIKAYTINASSTAAQKNTLQSIAQSGTSNKSNSIFGNIMKSAGNVASGLLNKAKSGLSNVGNFIGNIGNTIGNAMSGMASFFGGLFGKGEYVGRGKSIEAGTISGTDNSILGLNNFPYYSQHMNYSEKPSLSDSGCGPTSAAMVLSKVTGKNVLPDEIADETYKAGLYTTKGSKSALFPYIGNKYGVKVESTDDFNKVKEYAKQGIPMVVSGKGGKLYGTDSDGHIVATFGKNKNGYIVNDPSNPTGGVYNESQLRNGFQEAWVFGDQGFLQDLKDSEIVTRVPNKFDISKEYNKYLSEPMYGKGDSTSLTYVNGFPYWSQVAFGEKMYAACGPTTAAMVLTQVSGKEVNPKDLAKKGVGHGFSYTSGVTDPGLFKYYAGLYNTELEYTTSLKKVKEYAAQGYPLIVDGKCSKSSDWGTNCELTPYGPNGHYVALFGKTGDEYVINDPRGSKYSGKRSENQLSEGFRFAYKVGDKTYKLDPTKIKSIGSTSGIENTGSATEGTTTTDTSTTASSAPDFFTDMATAGINFSKKLFGFEIEPLANTTTSISGGICSRYSGTDYKSGQTVKASFTAYFPDSSALEGGYVDRSGHTLNPSEHTCAAPKEVPDGTRIQISNTGTSLDGMVYTVTDTGSAIVIKSDGTYRIDILVSREDYQSFQNCTGNITFLGKDGQSATVGTGDGLINNSDLFGTGEAVNWGYFCDPSKGHITSYFGEKRSQYANAQGEHGALDYNVKYQPLYAPKSGVVYSENDHSSYGNSLTIKTNTPDVYYRLAHMDKKAVKKGDTIKQGQYLGVSGNTGHSYGAHVHVEVLKGGTSKGKNGVDPLNYYDTTKASDGSHIKLKGSNLSFTDYMNDIGQNIIQETNEGGATTTTTDSGATTTTNSATDFFTDMITAGTNFSKKLFGFDIDPTGASDANLVGDSIALSGNDIAEQIFNYSKAKGCTPESAAGLVGNAYCESDFQPDLVNEIGASGLFQWLGGRFDKLKERAQSKGTDWTDVQTQLEHLWWELEGGESTTVNLLNKRVGGLEGFKALTDPYKAGYEFGKCFERGGYNEKRGTESKNWYDKLVSVGKGEKTEGILDGDDMIYGKGDKVKLSSKIIEYALSFLNKGFKYASDKNKRNYIDNNKDQADCSSFTHHVYDRAAETEIGNSTQDQYLKDNSKNISKENLKPSDILLFKNTRSNRTGRTNYKDGVSHAALYLGNNAYIHSTINEKGNGIKVSDIGSTWSKQHWLTGKRYIDPDKMVDPKVKNPNKLTGFDKATGSYTIPQFTTGWNATEMSGTTVNTGTQTATGFFDDMATAGVNFAKKLFGFDIEDTTSTLDSSSTGVVTGTYTSDEFENAVHMGDSITKGLSESGAVPSNRVVATIGDTAKKGKSHIDEVVSKNPSMVIMNYGTNDCPDGNLKWYQENYGDLIQKVKAKLPNTKIVLNKTFDSKVEPYKSNIPKFRNAIPQIASSNGASVVDSTGLVQDKYFAPDGIHFTNAFYKLWLQDMRNKLVPQGTGDYDNIDDYFEDTLNAFKTSDFGLRDDEFHTGVDYAAEEDTPISSPIEGRVVENTKDKEFGNTLVIRDKNKKDHRFAHMRNQSSYGLGSKIRKNDVIGNVGSTGRSTGSHLHYEVSDEKGISLNPKDYAIGGSTNKLDNVTLSFNDSNQKVNANISNMGKGEGISEKTLIRLINLVIQVLTKISNNTSNISVLVDAVKELQGNKTSTVNKYSSDTNKTKSQKLLSTLQKGLNSSDTDVTNLEYILSTLEKLASE